MGKAAGSGLALMASAVLAALSGVAVDYDLIKLACRIPRVERDSPS